MIYRNIAMRNYLLADGYSLHRINIPCSLIYYTWKTDILKYKLIAWRGREDNIDHKVGLNHK